MAYIDRMENADDLDVFSEASDEEACKLIGSRIRQLRQDGGHTQESLASLADVPLRTYKRFEADGKASLETFIRILRALDRAKYLHLVLPNRIVRVNSAYEVKIGKARQRWQR